MLSTLGDMRLGRLRGPCRASGQSGAIGPCSVGLDGDFWGAGRGSGGDDRPIPREVVGGRVAED